MISAEALFNGSRWRLTVKDDGTWTVARRDKSGPIWDDQVSGNRGLEGVRAASDDVRRFGEWFAEAGADVLWSLAEVAESGRAA